MQRIKDVNGVWRETKQEVHEVVQEYFSHMFIISNRGGKLSDHENVNRVSERNNDALITQVTLEEVKAVIFCMHPDKSLGPDGLNLLLF